MTLDPLEGHTDYISSVAFPPHGKHIVSGSYDKTIQVWDVQFENISLQLSPNDPIAIPTSESLNKDVPPSSTSLPSFTDDSTLQNGWMVNSSGEHLFWVPPWNRLGLHWPKTKLVIGERSTMIDFTHFKCGTSWEQCYTPTNGGASTVTD
ncbi:hypothetical protein BD410DRAFT_846022 [Rickenella mellea]|uniref:Uncharacterized protein n=1 Tax=Rickenella mellea TaxID=50990 RepID=A0A4Y7PGF8_9AGAM|nr:hypothetical protein BD410DRAFT_846022 [Rickenella mellea]